MIQRCSINFKSNDYRDYDMQEAKKLQLARQRARQRAQQEEAEAAELKKKKEAEEAEAARKAEEERKKQEAELQENRVRILGELKQEILKYPRLDDDVSKKVASFLLNFTFRTQEATQHDIREYFCDEETAEELRKNLSPECRQNSIALREQIQSIPDLKDPVMTLIAANNMKNFLPDDDNILQPEHKTNFIKIIKNTVVMAVKNGDFSKFDDDEKNAINEMIQMIKAAESFNFGISVKLQALVDKLNKKKMPELGFFPPVQVRQLEHQMQTAIKM